MEVFCGHCGVVNRGDRVFCLRCRRRLFPVTKFELTLDDFVYPGDKTNLSVVEDAGWIPAAFAGHRMRGQESAMRAQLAKSATRVENLSTLDLSMRRCGDELGLEMLPEAFVVPSNTLNAAVMGGERTSIFMISGVALQVLSVPEMEMVVGHELAHIKSRHMLYHTAAESISAGGSMIASIFGAGMIAYPLQMSLLAWHRESEVTADRAALLMGGNMNAFTSMLTKSLLYNGEAVESGMVGQLFRTHPEYQRRLALATEFYSSPEFARGREKLRKRFVRVETSATNCRSCGASYQPHASYCGSCGRSLR